MSETSSSSPPARPHKTTFGSGDRFGESDFHRPARGRRIRDSAETPVFSDAVELIQSAIEAMHSAEQVILNNIANANTVGFKRSRALFGDLPYRQVALPGSTDQQGRSSLRKRDLAIGNRRSGKSRRSSEAVVGRETRSGRRDTAACGAKNAR